MSFHLRPQHKPFIAGLAVLFIMLILAAPAATYAVEEPCLPVTRSRYKPRPALDPVRKIAVILVDFPGIPSPYRAQQVSESLSERQPGSPLSAFDVFAESSHGRYQLAFGSKPGGGAAIFGPYLVERPSGERCTARYAEWSKQAAALALSEGYRRSQYRHTVFLFPRREALACPVTGIGEIDGDTVWLFGLEPSSFVHEIGHNLGLFHAGRRDSTGLLGQYGDLSSPMGAFQPHTVLFAAPERTNLEWTSAGELQSISPGSSARRILFSLERLREQTRLRILKIPLPDQSSYIVSFRQELPEAPSSRSRSYVRGTSIHREFGLGLTTRLIATLRDGEAFIDEVNNLQISQVAHTATTATIDLAPAPFSRRTVKGCFVIDPCRVTPEQRTPIVRDCRGFSADLSTQKLVSTPRCPTRAPGEDFDLDGLADSSVQAADADGDGVPNEEDCNPLSALQYRLYRYTDTDSDGAYEAILPIDDGACGSERPPAQRLDESKLDSCPTTRDPLQIDNDLDDIGDACQQAPALAASRRRILPYSQQLLRSATMLRTLSSGSARSRPLAKATASAIKRFLAIAQSEPALTPAVAARLSAAARALSTAGNERADATALAVALAALSVQSYTAQSFTPTSSR